MIWYLVAGVLVVLGIGIAVDRAVNRADDADVGVPPSAPVELTERVQTLLRQGKKIQAIKEVRMARSIGLKDAKELVEAIESGHAITTGLPDPTSPAAFTSDQSALPAPSAADLATAARQIRDTQGAIHAVKYVHEQTGMGLAEAKQFVDALR
ncbi:MAG: ribosomal protein L7/L12 [Jatrophihabitans sp.]